jgi:hypothetical protein
MHFFMLAVGMHFDVIHVLKSATNSCKKVHFGCGKAIRSEVLMSGRVFGGL